MISSNDLDNEFTVENQQVKTKINKPNAKGEKAMTEPVKEIRVCCKSEPPPLPSRSLITSTAAFPWVLRALLRGMKSISLDGSKKVNRHVRTAIK